MSLGKLPARCRIRFVRVSLTDSVFLYRSDRSDQAVGGISRSPYRALVLGLLLALLSACAPPAQRLAQEARELGFLPVLLKGGSYTLRGFYKSGPAQPGELHVYLEGDGLPWTAKNRIADDPTTHNPLMLRLMARDAAPSLYLGRPCYDGHSGDAGCTPMLWTHHRYSPIVVSSMAGALRQFLRRHPRTDLHFFGHSGGGALALLLAGEFPETQAVVTLAGNLAPDRWAAYHGYSPLEGSLDPASVRNTGFAEYHFAGAEDVQVPPWLNLSVCERRQGARMIEVAGVSHARGWDSIWERVLRETAAPKGGSPHRNRAGASDRCALRWN